MSKDISTVLNELKKLGNVDRAIKDKKYHKSKREHWGVPVPLCTLFASSLSKGLSEKERLELALNLWETDLFDSMICSIKILTSPQISPSSDLWNLVVIFLQKIDGWALEDTLAPVAWRSILADETRLDFLESWMVDKNFWMRRAALVYTLPFAKAGRNPERSLGWASRYASDLEWFIQKAIGWWLRVLGESNPERVILFLNAHWNQLKGVARREATRKLASEWLQNLSCPIKEVKS